MFDDASLIRVGLGFRFDPADGCCFKIWAHAACRLNNCTREQEGPQHITSDDTPDSLAGMRTQLDHQLPRQLLVLGSGTAETAHGPAWRQQGVLLLSACEWMLCTFGAGVDFRTWWSLSRPVSEYPRHPQ
jgi:hypothetical protein